VVGKTSEPTCRSPSGVSAQHREPGSRFEDIATMAPNNGVAALDQSWLPVLGCRRQHHELQIPHRDFERSDSRNKWLLTSRYGGPRHWTCREALRRRMHTDRCHVVRTLRATHFRIRSPRLPKPIPLSHIHAPRRPTTIPPPAPLQNQRHSPSDAYSRIQHGLDAQRSQQNRRNLRQQQPRQR